MGCGGELNLKFSKCARVGDDSVTRFVRKLDLALEIEI